MSKKNEHIWSISVPIQYISCRCTLYFLEDPKQLELDLEEYPEHLQPSKLSFEEILSC